MCNAFIIIIIIIIVVVVVIVVKNNPIWKLNTIATKKNITQHITIITLYI